MAEQTVTPIRRKTTPKAPRLLLTELPDETVYRVACVLKYMAYHPHDSEAGKADGDEEFGAFILLHDLAEALKHAHEMNYGRSAVVAHD